MNRARKGGPEPSTPGRWVSRHADDLDAVDGAVVVVDNLVVALAAVEGGGAEDVPNAVGALAADEDVTLIELIDVIITTEAAEHVATICALAGEIVVPLGAADVGGVARVEVRAETDRLARQL